MTARAHRLKPDHSLSARKKTPVLLILILTDFQSKVVVKRVSIVGIKLRKSIVQHVQPLGQYINIFLYALGDGMG